MVRTAKLKQMPAVQERREYSFTVVFERLAGARVESPNGHRNRSSKKTTAVGYQVTVPLLPGLITYGRTMTEARVMALDAIKCYLEGLRKGGEPIPDEKSAVKEKLRVAL